MSDLYDDDILKMFVEEAREHLEAIESDLLALEAGGSSPDPALINRIFRAVHTIKGSAGCLGFTRISELAHELECVFAAIRDGKLVPNPTIVSKSLLGFDLLTDLVHRATESQGVDIGGMVQEIQDLLKQPEPEEQRLGEILIQTGAITPGQLEEALSRQKTPSQNSIRMDAEKIDLLFNLIGEAVIAQSQVLSLAKRVQGDDAHELRGVIGKLGHHVTSLHREILDARMIPVGPTFSRFARVVRDLSLSLEKKIELVIEGEETRLDKTVIERIGDPLMHLVRNAIDHGLETPEERTAMGKHEQGKLTLKAEKKGYQILVHVSDDGKGMDPEKLKQKAVEKGLLSPEKAATLSDRQAFDLVFAPGFSTKTEVTDISGRGVGMDVVKTNIQQLNGTVEVDSELGQGTRFTIYLPMSLALSNGLFFEASGQEFIIPLDQIEEVVKLPWNLVHATPDGEFGVHRGELIPIFRIHRLLGLPESQRKGDGAHLLLVHSNGKRIGFFIDRPRGEQEIVVKPLHESLQGLPGLSGATILGDGRVLLILDSEKLLQLAARPRLEVIPNSA